MIWTNQRQPSPIPVKDAACLLGVSKSGYYYWLKRKGHDNRAARDRPILEEIHKIIHKYPGYGYRRMTHQLTAGKTGGAVGMVFVRLLFQVEIVVCFIEAFRLQGYFQSAQTV